MFTNATRKDIAVLSDIHGNYEALKECIDFALKKNIQTFIFLGDYVGELAYPQNTMELIYSLKEKYTCYFVKGNKEDYWIQYSQNGEKGWKKYDSTTGSLYYTYHNLTEKDIDFFSELQISSKVIIEGLPTITICHGSTRKVNEKMLENDNTYELMEQDENDIILCGHTHIRGIIEHCGKKVINPGAVGVALHSDGHAQFMILHGENSKWQTEFVDITYDVEKTIKDLSFSGLDKYAPYWCTVTKNLLRTGETTHGSVLAKAMQYCREELNECIWPEIPEKYWEMAVNEMICKS